MKTDDAKNSQWRAELTAECERLNNVIAQIRAEIKELDIYYDNDCFSTNNCPMYKCYEVLRIIDKYRG